jgi:NitT/TauT family transport system substrate-binding protein
MAGAGQPKPAFYVVVGLVVVALIGFAVYRSSDILAPKAPGDAPRPINPGDLGAGGPGGDVPPVAAESNENAANITTVKEYKFQPAATLPPVKGVSAYRPLADETVRFAINVWAGWAPIILAKDGFQAGRAWKTADGKEFKVELALIDNPVTMRDAYAAGDVQIGWGTLDMLPLFMEGFVDKGGKPRDSRVMPRVYQQVDWSNGGDGIVVRESVKTVSDLRGKTLVLAQNSPSQYFALNMLVAGGVQPAEVQMIFTDDAFQAAAAFNAQKDIAGAVSWSPDIYNLAKVRGNRMLVTTAQANKLIADIWFARADFAKDRPEVIEGLVRGIFDGMERLKQEPERKHVAELMAKGYNIPAPDALGMLGDAHSTNWAENYQFFLNQNNPTSFERIWNQSYLLYRRIGSIRHQPVSFDHVMDFSVLKKLGKEDRYSSQKGEYTSAVAPKELGAVRAEGEEILTNTIVLRFYPNSWDLDKKITREVDGKAIEERYEPNAELVLDEVAKLAGQFSAARIIIEGHTDNSMQGQIPTAMVKELSLNRANAVKESLLKKYKTLDPNRFNVDGLGWDQPADPNDPHNNAKNRRVEVKVYTAEKA